MINRSSVTFFLSSQETGNSRAVTVFGAWQIGPREKHSLTFQNDVPEGSGPGSLPAFQASPGTSCSIDHSASVSAVNTKCNICQDGIIFPKHSLWKWAFEIHSNVHSGSPHTHNGVPSRSPAANAEAAALASHAFNDSLGTSTSAVNAYAQEATAQEPASYCPCSSSSYTARRSTRHFAPDRWPTTEQIPSFVAHPRVVGSWLNLRSTWSVSSVVYDKTPIRRQKMIRHSKFGDFGALEGRFPEPSGVAIYTQGDIIVADTNRHRMQIVFDAEGRFKLRFGERAKNNGQLHYPNRVYVVRVTHQVRLLNQHGQLPRKFGSTVLQHPRAVAVDSKSRTIVIESKIMRVTIFDLWGNIPLQFSRPRYLEFHNGATANDKMEIFISGGRAGRVKVFSYKGAFLHLIEEGGLTNYPTAVCIKRQRPPACVG